CLLRTRLRLAILILFVRERGRRLHSSAEATASTATVTSPRNSRGGRSPKANPCRHKLLTEWKANPTRRIKMARRSRVRSRHVISSVNRGAGPAARRQRTGREPAPRSPSKGGPAKGRFG